MSWLEISISTQRDHVEIIQDLLESLEAQAVTLLDDADQPVLEPQPGQTPLWPSVCIRGLFDATVNTSLVEADLMTLDCDLDPTAVLWRKIADKDWERAWMDRFAPMQFGAHLWIVPSGMASPDDPSAVIIKLDPGLAFGTGTHPTTALCLQWIDGHDFHDQSVVDYGCGSGILGIAACLKGAREVICVDNDSQALEATVENAERNGVTDRVRCLSPGEFGKDPIAHGGADIMLANILAGPLIELSGRLTHSLKPAGRLVLSGLLANQGEEVNDNYHDGFGTMNEVSQDGWLRLDAVKLKQV